MSRSKWVITDFSFQDFQLYRKSKLFSSSSSCQIEILLILRAPYARFLQLCLATRDLPRGLANLASIWVLLKMIPIPVFSHFGLVLITWLHVSFPVFLCDFEWLPSVHVLSELDYLNFYQIQNWLVSADVWLKGCGGYWGCAYLGWSWIQSQEMPREEKFLGTTTPAADYSTLLTSFAPNSLI